MWGPARARFLFRLGSGALLGSQLLGLQRRALHCSPASCGKNLLKKFASKTRYRGGPRAGRGQQRAAGSSPGSRLHCVPRPGRSRVFTRVHGPLTPGLAPVALGDPRASPRDPSAPPPHATPGLPAMHPAPRGSPPCTLHPGAPRLRPAPRGSPPPPSLRRLQRGVDCGALPEPTLSRCHIPQARLDLCLQPLCGPCYSRPPPRAPLSRAPAGTQPAQLCRP